MHQTQIIVKVIDILKGLQVVRCLLETETRLKNIQKYQKNIWVMCPWVTEDAPLAYKYICILSKTVKLKFEGFLIHSGAKCCLSNH